ncbi:MAG TPA: cyclase family protein [bacterium]|nr:cyclase family protein [bacterium]
MPLIDLSHVIEAGMMTYPGLPGPEIGTHLSREDSRAHYAPGTEFHIGRISLVANTGTYVDVPFHRFAHGQDLAQVSLQALANLEALVLHWPEERGRAVDDAAFAGLDVRGKAVLVHTGWSRHWRTERYFSGHPHLTGAAAEWLVAAGARLVGIDSLNIDSTVEGSRPVHTVLLEQGVPIVEHLTNLAALPERGARFFAVPPKISGLGTFPVRAFAVT